jgi:hypothetical protein
MISVPHADVKKEKTRLCKYTRLLKDVVIQLFVPGRVIVAFAIGVLLRFTWLDIFTVCAARFSPFSF